MGGVKGAAYGLSGDHTGTQSALDCFASAYGAYTLVKLRELVSSVRGSDTCGVDAALVGILPRDTGIARALARVPRVWAPERQASTIEPGG